MGLQTSLREINIHEVLSCELSPVPISLFTPSGVMRISKSKSMLKNSTKIEVSARHASQQQSCTVIDGCALLWIPHWPASSVSEKPVVADFVKKFKHGQVKLLVGDVYLAFDRYQDYSTTCSTRSSRGSECCKIFQLNSTTCLPSQKITFLTVTQNKRQLIDIICKDMEEDVTFQRNST